MSTSTLRHRALIAVALPAVAAFLLTGCTPDEGGEQAEDSAQESASEMDGGGLPEDFPASVPLIDGEVSVESAGSGDADGWVLEEDGVTVRFCGNARPNAGERIRVRAKGEGANGDDANACEGRGSVDP